MTQAPGGPQDDLLAPGLLRYRPIMGRSVTRMKLETRRIPLLKHLALVVGLSAAALLSSACNNMNDPNSVPDGAYTYTGFDAGGTVVVRGWLMLDLSSATDVSGSWHLEAVGNPPQLGPQVGEGQLTGQRSASGSLVINLNPGSADSNVFLNGTLDGNAFRGQ